MTINQEDLYLEEPLDEFNPKLKFHFDSVIDSNGDPADEDSCEWINAIDNIVDKIECLTGTHSQLDELNDDFVILGIQTFFDQLQGFITSQGYPAYLDSKEFIIYDANEARPILELIESLGYDMEMA